MTPDPFTAILDQADALGQLRRALAADRLPHGLVFAGPTGVGKRLTATALGKVFLCDGGRAAASVRLIDAGTHPDFHVVNKELVRQLKGDKVKGTTLSIEVVRSFLLEPAGNKSVTGQGKFFVVEEADAMQAAAQNALLKTLEEPAGRTCIVLLTDKAEDLLPTIRSRTRTIRFGLLTETTVINQLKLRDVPPDMAKRAAGVAEGSIGLALQWINEGVIERATELDRLLDDLLAGQTADLAEWLKVAADAYAVVRLDADPAASKDFATRNGINVYLHLAGRHLRRRLRDETHADELETLCVGIDALADTERYLDGNVNIPLALQNLGVSMNFAFRTTR